MITRNADNDIIMFDSTEIESSNITKWVSSINRQLADMGHHVKYIIEEYEGNIYVIQYNHNRRTPI